MVGPQDLARYARDHGVPVRVLSDLGSVRTVVEASEALERAPGQIGNTVLITVRGDPVLVVVPGDRRVDGAAVGRAMDAGPLEVALATQNEVREHTDSEPGLIPPFGHPTSIPLFVDERVLSHDRILVPAGSPDTLIELDPSGLARLAQAQVGDWSEPIDTAAS